MKTLLILRHAKSSWKHSELSDHDRPLNKRGKRDAPRLGRLLQDEGLTPDLILSSTAKRAQKTAETVAENCGYAGDVLTTSDLYLAGPSNYRDVLRQISNDYDRGMVVGHNPGLEILLEQLTGKSEQLPTGALVHLRLPIRHWNEFDVGTGATLVNLWRPRELP